MKLNSLQDLYFDQLSDMHNAEQQLAKALEKLAKSSNNERLRECFSEHLEETKSQIDRIEQIFANHDSKPKKEKCHAMEGIIKEGEELMKREAEPSTHDAALICAGQKAEHYEIATYGTLKAYAKILGDKQAQKLLEESEKEEIAADRKLTGLAMEICNQEAKQEGQGGRAASRRS